MLASSAPVHAAALSVLECGLTAIAVAVSFAWPTIGFKSFARVESVLTRFARRKRLAVTSVGLGALFLRLAILPVFPVPLPYTSDDFSFLLSADTFVHGRLANETPAMWTHFESVQISMQPTYTSMYFPGEGLFLAAGKILLGHPWYGILIANALMCAAICWMLQAWVPPGWALLGGVLAIVRLGLFSYWINMYNGAGSIAALGGAIVLGSLPRLKRTAGFRYGLSMALGVVLVALTRPFEGVLLCLPVGVVLGHWALFGKNRPKSLNFVRLASVPLALILAALAWLGYYDFRAFGNPLTLPYTINRATYATAPYFIWQRQRPEPVYRHQEMRGFYQFELDEYSKIRSRNSFIPMTLRKALNAIQFYAGYALLPSLLMLPVAVLDRRIRYLVLCVLLLMAGMLIMVYMLPHYVAPFTAAFYAIGLQSMRHLRLWTPEGKAAGWTMVRLSVCLCIVLAGVRLLSSPLRLNLNAGDLPQTWYGPDRLGEERAKIEAYLEHMPGNQLALVRYAHKRAPVNEWVYNSAEIDSSKVVWAGEIDPTADLELLNHYRDRKVWLIEPDATPARVSPYSLALTSSLSPNERSGTDRRQIGGP